MLGFLAAVITIFFAIGHSRTFKNYKREGYFSAFLCIYLLAVVCLIFTFFLSLFGFSHTGMPSVFRWSLIMTVNSAVQILAISVIIVNMTRKAVSE